MFHDVLLTVESPKFEVNGTETYVKFIVVQTKSMQCFNNIFVMFSIPYHKRLMENNNDIII